MWAYHGEWKSHFDFNPWLRDETVTAQDPGITAVDWEQVARGEMRHVTWPVAEGRLKLLQEVTQPWGVSMAVPRPLGQSGLRRGGCRQRVEKRLVSPAWEGWLGLNQVCKDGAEGTVWGKLGRQDCQALVLYGVRQNKIGNCGHLEFIFHTT